VWSRPAADCELLVVVVDVDVDELLVVVDDVDVDELLSAGNAPRVVADLVAPDPQPASASIDISAAARTTRDRIT
jgi:hypothetical protein